LFLALWPADAKRRQLAELAANVAMSKEAHVTLARIHRLGRLKRWR
jgi:hypothetical protein